MAQPEHALQVQCVKFVRDCVAADHEFWACDRSKKQSELQHVREKSRGIRAGVSDTTLAVVGMPEIYIELKAGKNTPTDAQKDFGARMWRVGRKWYWANSVEFFRECLVAAGVPLRPNAHIVAMHLDALLAGTKARKTGKAPRSYKPRTAAPARSAIAAAQRSWAFQR
jgi:hypothetical protein